MWSLRNDRSLTVAAPIGAARVSKRLLLRTDRNWTSADHILHCQGVA